MCIYDRAYLLTPLYAFTGSRGLCLVWDVLLPGGVTDVSALASLFFLWCDSGSDPGKVKLLCLSAYLCGHGQQPWEEGGVEAEPQALA